VPGATAAFRPVSCALLVGSVCAAGCASAKPPVESGEIAAAFTFDPADLTDGAIADQVPAHTTAWPDFVVRSRRAFGHAPAGFELVSIRIAVASGDASVSAALEEALSGEVGLWLAPAGSDSPATAVQVASAASLSGTGPVTLDVTADRARLFPIYDQLVTSDFVVRLSGQTPRIPADTFSFPVTLTMAARAFAFEPE
jgi:hypothetical protein